MDKFNLSIKAEHLTDYESLDPYAVILDSIYPQDATFIKTDPESGRQQMNIFEEQEFHFEDDEKDYLLLASSHFAVKPEVSQVYTDVPPHAFDLLTPVQVKFEDEDMPPKLTMVICGHSKCCSCGHKPDENINSLSSSQMSFSGTETMSVQSHTNTSASEFHEQAEAGIWTSFTDRFIAVDTDNNSLDLNPIWKIKKKLSSISSNSDGSQSRVDNCMPYNSEIDEMYSISQLESMFSKKETKYKCTVCGKASTNSSNLKVHMRTHSGQRPYVCVFCNAKFRQSPHLIAHKRRHTGEKPYHCDKCELSFVQKSSLKTHFTNIHAPARKSFGRSKKAASVETSIVRNFYCNICDKTYINECYKKEHMREHKENNESTSNLLLQNANPAIKVENEFMLPIGTGSYYKELRKLLTVIVDHGKKNFECKICKKCFRQSGNAYIHLRRHTGQRPYKCDYCGNRFRQLHHLEDHTNSHRGIRPFECMECQREFSRASARNKHMKKVHMK